MYMFMYIDVDNGFWGEQFHSLTLLRTEEQFKP